MSGPLGGEYRANGFVIVRGVLRGSLLADLRSAVARVRARNAGNVDPQAQRIQPIAEHLDASDREPFARYLEADALRDVVDRVLGPGFGIGSLDGLGVLIEPRDHPWQMRWHRDIVVELPVEARDRRVRAFLHRWWNDPRHFNQVNTALYPDSCLWFVPGSHARERDEDGEVESVRDAYVPAGSPAGAEVVEAQLLAHCRRMPGARQIHLDAGDVLVYRQLGWHMGSYSPRHPRATLHHLVPHSSPNEFQPAWERAKAAALSRRRWKRVRRAPVSALARRAGRRRVDDRSTP